MLDQAALEKLRERSPQERWEAYWSEMAMTVGEAMWDGSPDADIERQLEFAGDDMDRSMVLVDLGCGNGRRSRALAERFPRVVGVDVSAEAVRGAQKLYQAPNLEFRVLDATDPSQAEALHDELGDANVYVSAMFHALKPHERDLAAQSLATLIGAAGRALVEELGDEADKATMSHHGPPPAKIVKLIEAGISPGAMSVADFDETMQRAGLRIIRHGVGSHETTERGPDGAPISTPLDNWVLARA